MDNLYSFLHGFWYTGLMMARKIGPKLSHLCNKPCFAWRNSFGYIYWFWAQRGCV